MSEFVPVCKLEDIAPGEARQFRVGGKEIVLARLAAGDCYSIGGRCTHLGAALGKGGLDGTALTCPWHGSQFDVTSGHLIRWVQEPWWMRMGASLVPHFLRRDVPSYQVKVEDGQVFVRLSD